MTVSVSSFSNFLSLIEAGTWTASDQGTGAFYSGTPPIGSKAYDLSFANRSSDDIKNGTWPKNWILAQEYFKNTQPSYWINSTEIGKEIGSLSKNGQFTSWAESQLPSDSSQTTIKSLALNLENQAWAEASKLYANQATGDVIAFVNGANVGTTDSYTGAVFAQIELPRLLRNQSVTTINGIDREVLVKNYYGVSDDTQVSLTTGTNLDALQRVLDVLAISSEKYVPSTGSSNSGGGGSSTLPDDDDTSQDVGSNTTVNSNGDGNNLYMMGDYSTINAAGKNNTISSYGTGGTLNGTTQIVLLYGVVPGTTQQTFNMNGDDNSVRIIGSYNLLLSGNGNIINSNSYGSNFSTNYIKINIKGSSNTFNDTIGKSIINFSSYTFDNTIVGGSETITASYDVLNVKGTYDLVTGDQDTINVEDGTSTSVVGVDTINMAAGSNNDWVNDDHADYVNIGGVDDTINAASGNTVAIADHTWDNTVLGENEKITASYDALNVKGTYDLVSGDQDTINVEDGTSTSVVGVDTINMAAGSNNDWVNDDHADYVNIGGVDDTINAASGNTVAIADHTWDNTVLGENEKITASYDALNVKGTYDLVTGDQDTINVEDGTSTSVVGVDTINMAAGSNNDWVNSYSGDYVNIDGSNDTINAATGNTVHIGSNVTGDNVIGSASKIFSLSNSTFSVNGAGNTTEISSNSNVKISGDKNIINAGTSSEGSSVTISGQQYTLNVGCSNITINSSTTNNNNTLEWSSSEITNGTLSTIVIADNTKNIIINGSFCDVILGKNCSIVMNGGADVIFGLSNDSIKIVGSGGNRVYASNSYVESDGINGNKAFTDVYGNKIKANGSVDIYHYDNENLFNNTSSIQYDDSRSSSGNPGFAFEDESDTGGTGVPSTSFDWSSSSLGGGSGSSDDDDIDDDDDTDSDSEIYAEDGLSASASQYVDVLNQSGENGLSQTDGWQRAEDAIKEAATGATAEMTPLSEPVNAGGNATITWNFAQDNPGSANDLYAGSIQDQYQDAIETAINEWSQATGLTFKEVSDTSSSDIRIGWGDFDTTCTGVAGLTFYGDSSNPSDLIELENPLQDALVSNGTNDYDYAGTSVDLTQLALHEIGHTLGLAESSNQYSIMFPELGENNRSLDSQDVAEVKDLYHLSSDTSVTALLKQAAATFDVGGATGSLVTTSHSDTFENPLLAVHAA